MESRSFRVPNDRDYSGKAPESGGTTGFTIARNILFCFAIAGLLVGALELLRT